MPKVDVGVGDEFPAEENGQVHHHYYHFDRGCRPRRPFRLLRLILSIMLIICVVRLFSFTWSAPFWLAPQNHAAIGAFYPLGSVLCAIAVLCGALWLLRRTDRS